jgi:two-component sensor histidine kinase
MLRGTGASRTSRDLALDSDGKPTAIHAISRDITERKHAEARQLVLIRELQHRTKYMLAVVQSLVCSSIDHSSSLQNAKASITGRLHALARDFVASGAGGGVPLHDLIEGELSTFRPHVSVATSTGTIWLGLSMP